MRRCAHGGLSQANGNLDNMPMSMYVLNPERSDVLRIRKLPEHLCESERQHQSPLLYRQGVCKLPVLVRVPHIVPRAGISHTQSSVYPKSIPDAMQVRTVAGCAMPCPSTITKSGSVCSRSNAVRSGGISRKDNNPGI